MIKLTEVRLQPGQGDVIMRMLIDCFRNAVAARTTQIEDKYRKWQDNYDAVPKQAVRSQPFQGASNFMPQLIRMHTDILAARVTGIIAATRPMWQPTSFLTEVPAEAMLALGQWMQYTSMYRLSMFEKVDLLVHSCFKSGTTVMKDWWREETRFTVTGSQDGKVQDTEVNESDLTLAIVPFEDFYPYPLTSLTLKDCEIKFQRIRLTKSQVEQRRNSKLWIEDACDVLLKSPGPGASNSQQQTVQNSGITLTPDTGRPYSVIEAHFTYELTAGRTYSCIAVFNPGIEGVKGLLRMYYQPGSDPFSDPFTDFRLFPSDKNFYVTCVPAVLEDSQEEQAQIHNARRDANRIANIPGWKKRRYADVGSPSTEWYPGKVFELDDMNDLVPLEFQGNYNSLVEEESFLLQLAERYTGVSPAAQGQGSGVNGKRGTYASQGTLAMLAESNRRLDTYIKRVRLPFHRLGKRIYTSYRDFGDADEFQKWGGNAQLVSQLFAADSKLVGGHTFFDLSASDSGANRETDRSGLLLMANTMSAYYHELVQMLQMAASAPQGSPVQELMLQIADGAHDLANRLLFHFDIDSRSKLLPDLRKVLAGGASGPGGPQQASQGAPAAALPESQGPVSPEQLQQLQGQLAQFAGGGPAGRPQ